MKKILSVVIVLVIMIPSCASSQKPGTLWPAGEPGTDYNVRNADKTKEGLWIRAYPNKNLYYRGQFHKNIPTGKFEFYYETGELMSTVDHIQDSTINDVVNFYPDGRAVMSKGRYVGKIEQGKFIRQKEGEWFLYLSDGTLSAQEIYKNNELNGNCRYYFPNSKLCKEVKFQNGIEEGLFVEYYDDGLKKSEGNYHLGEFDGEFKTYFPGGQIETKGQYSRGVKDGLWLYFQQSGRVEMTVKFQGGKETARRYDNGTFTEYYDDGIPKSEYTYEDGKKNGPFSEWYDLGEFITVPTTPEEAQMGIELRQKLTGTQLKVTGDYLDDHPEGELTWYNENGSVQKVEQWENGKLVKTTPGR